MCCSYVLSCHLTNAMHIRIIIIIIISYTYYINVYFLFIFQGDNGPH